MKIVNFSKNNIKNLDRSISTDCSYSISGNSGSGKSSFCSGLAQESVRRFVTLLPKSEYQFLYSDLRAEHGLLNVQNLPFIHYTGNITLNSNPRSTVGTYSGLFKTIRKKFAAETDKPSDFFSFNTPINWCAKCKGKGVFNGVVCPQCKGERYNPKVKQYTINGPQRALSIVDVNNLSFNELLELKEIFSNDINFERIIKHFISLNVGYVTLTRALATLSGGELTRVHLASIFPYTRSSLVILDELSLGLDNKSVISVLDKQKELGLHNQLWFIDHDKFVRDHAEKAIFFGPGAGPQGGKIIDKIPLVDPVYPEKKEKKQNLITVKDLHCRNIQMDKLSLPTRALTVFTGESGCGKTTLLRDCIYPILQKQKKDVVIIGQNKNKNITSRSTLFTYFGLSHFYSFPKKNAVPCTKCAGLGLSPDGTECIYCQGKGLERKAKNKKIPFTIYELFDQTIDHIVDSLPDCLPKKRLQLLKRLGAGHLSLWRPLRTLSTGEFQCVHLAFESVDEKECEKIFIFDEPSRGMSQNILNSLGAYLYELGCSGHTLWIIEHTKYFFRLADYIVDFGERRSVVDSLEIVSADIAENKHSVVSEKIKSAIPNNYGISFQGGTDFFDRAQNSYYANLKNLSPTARWVYAHIQTPSHSPVVAIDFEKTSLFSSGTFLFDVNALANQIGRYAEFSNGALESFDYMNKKNLCTCCKGKGVIEWMAPAKFIANENKDLFNGLITDSYYKALKKFNYSKIKFMLKNISKRFSIDLMQPYSAMSQREKDILWNGLWNYRINDSKEGRVYTWQGLNFLIKKYVRSESKKMKDFVAEASEKVQCPICSGNHLSERHELNIHGKDIRQWLQLNVKDIQQNFPDISFVQDLMANGFEDVQLCDDVSLLPIKKKIILKLLEIKDKSFMGYTFVFKNIRPYMDFTDPVVLNISERNSLVVCDGEENKLTHENLLDKITKHSKTLPKKFGFDLFGYKKVTTEINKVKKQNACPYCAGKGKIEVKSPDAGIDDQKILCESCSGHGFNENILKLRVQEQKIETWLNGDSSLLEGTPPKNAEWMKYGFPLLQKIQDWPKDKLYNLLSVLGG